jgi:hypothetical protein
MCKDFSIVPLPHTSDNCPIVGTLIAFPFLEHLLQDPLVVTDQCHGLPRHQFEVYVQGSMWGHGAFDFRTRPSLLAKTICSPSHNGVHIIITQVTNHQNVGSHKLNVPAREKKFTLWLDS